MKTKEPVDLKSVTNGMTENEMAGGTSVSYTVIVYGDPAKPAVGDKVTDNPYREVSKGQENTNGDIDSKYVETEVVDDAKSHKYDGETIMTTVATEETKLDESTVGKLDTTDMKEESDNYPIAEPEKSKEEESKSEETPQQEDTEMDKSDENISLTTPGDEQEPQPEPITTRDSVIEKPNSMKTKEPVDLKSVTNGMTENEMAGGTSEDPDSKQSEDVVTPGDGKQEALPVLMEDHDSKENDVTEMSKSERPELEITMPYDIDSEAEAITDAPTQNDVQNTALPLNTHLDDIGVVGHSIGPDSEQENITKSMTLEVNENTDSTYDESNTMRSVVLDHKIDSDNITVANGDSHSLPVDTNGDKLTVDLGPTTTENIPSDDVDNGDGDKDDHDEKTDETQPEESELTDEVPHMTVAAPLQHRIIDYNGKATVRCFVTGYPMPSYEWYHEGKRIPVVRGRIKDRVFGWGSRIIIKNITEADKGRYACVAKNSAGERTLEGSVTVRGVAKVEDIQVVIMSPTEALVDWKAPSYIASGATYIVRFYTEDNRALKYHFSTTRTEAYYRNLIPNMAYTFRVKMQRGNRLSVFSDPITVRTFPLGPKDTDGTTEISPKVTKNTKMASHTNIESTTASIEEKSVSITKSTKDEADVAKQPTPAFPSPEEVGMTTNAPEEDIPVETTTELAESLLITDAPIPYDTKDMIPSTLPEVAMNITTSPVLTTDTHKESTTVPLKITPSDGIESTTAGREMNPADSGTSEPPIQRLTPTTVSGAQTSVKAEDVTHKNNESESTRQPAAEDYLRLIKPLESVTAIVGERVLLRCLVEAKPQATFLWNKGGNPLETSGSKIKQRQFLKGSMLTFKSISMSDAGMYTCIALNSKVVETSGNITVIPNGMQKTTKEPEPSKSHTVMKRSVRPEDGDKPVSHASTGTYTTLLPTLMEEAFVTPDAESPKITTVSQHDSQVVTPDDKTVVVRVTAIDPEKVEETGLGSLNARPSQTWDSSRRNEPYVEIKKYMDDQNVEVGDRVVFLCRIIGDPKPRFLWYKDGAPIVFDDTRMKERVLEAGSRFTIKRTLLIDAGVYTCYGLNDYQTVSMRATLEVSNSQTYVSPYSYPQPSTNSPRTKPTKPRTKPQAETTSLISYQPTDPFTPQATKSYTKQPDCIGEISKLCLTNELVGKKVDINERISLRCQIYGDPQPEYRWYRNGERVYPSKLGPIREKIFSWGSRLAFRGVQESDTGEYRCLAINAAGIKDTKAWLLVGPYATIPPRIETEPPTTTVNVQTTPAKTRPPKKTPKPTVTRPPKRTTPRIEPTEVFLPSTTPNPNAKVKCISGSNGELCYTNMQNQIGETGGYVVLSCRITGTPAPSYTWFKDGVLIVVEDVDEADEELHRIRIKTMPWGSRLVIKGVRYSDAGTYFCVGSNVVSHIIQADLKVVQGSTSKPKPKPSKPKPSKPKTPKPPKSKTPKPKPSRPVEERTPPPVHKPRPDSGAGNNGPEQPEGGPDDGRCVVYTGSTCRRYLKSQMVYIDGGVDLYSIDTQLQATLQTLSAIDMQCINYLEPFLCFKAFPLCDDYGSRKSLCQEDCSVLTRSYCRDLTDLKAVYPGQYLWMPSNEDCLSLPSVRQDSDCTSVGLTNSNNNKSPTEGTKPDGKCKPYNTDGICSEYVGSRNTFFKSGFTLESIETTVMSIFTAALTLGSVSRECSNYLLPYICLRALPPCNRNGRPLEVCREDCDVLSNDICREDFKTTLASDSVDNSLFMLNDCLSLPSETGKYSCTTLSIAGEFRATQTDVIFPTSPQPTRNCEPYKGTVCSKYFSGRTVYLERGQSQAELEAEVSKVQQLLAQEADMETTCENYLFKEICFNMLPVCNSRGKKREICREECSQLHNDHCYKDYRTLQVLLRGRDDVLAQCSALPRKSEIRGPTCVELGVASLPQVPPQVEVDLEMDSNERQTSIVTLRCRATGSPRPTVEWSKDGDTLESTNTISLERNKVRIRVVSEREAGTYTCTARNSGGSDYQNMLIELV
ncbi:muscle M-line assembly protein unc-89-like [Anneissia japonica]|uniref:muscle M-line assembly protein unc-89-like n=1 Tax=Anneissia japonica TaxID=1529436 RepID=UPI00142590BD|nr:muscle M-line assembly protein unc-89-like [Anneissia japonica]